MFLYCGKPFVCFDSGGGVGNGSAGSAKQKALRRAVGGGLKLSTTRNNRKIYF